jgi:hypothetical protein
MRVLSMGVIVIEFHRAQRTTKRAKIALENSFALALLAGMCLSLYPQCLQLKFLVDLERIMKLMRKVVS